MLETLTISKTKDMIQITNNNYKNIYEVLSRQSQENISQENIFQENISQENITLINSLPNTISFNESNNMKNELTNYLREELNDS